MGRKTLGWVHILGTADRIEVQLGRKVKTTGQDGVSEPMRPGKKEVGVRVVDGEKRTMARVDKGWRMGRKKRGRER